MREPFLVNDPLSVGHVTVRDGKAGLPFSKGLLATSIMASGLAPLRAYRVAELVEQQLHRRTEQVVGSAELIRLAAETLAEEIGPRYADNYLNWQQTQSRTLPLIVLIGGTTGVGKSTVATTVANRLGIVRIVSTDAVREVMRGILTREMMPSLHTSTFDVPSVVRDPFSEVDPAVAGFRQQVRSVLVGVSQIIRRAVMEGTDLIVEGAHVVPGFFEPPCRSEAIVAPLILSLDDEQVHRSHFVARSQDTRSRESSARHHQRYLDHLTDIRAIQRYLLALAREHGVPVVPSYSLDATVSKVTELVVAAATDSTISQPLDDDRHGTDAMIRQE